MSEHESRSYPGMIERDSTYWHSLVAQIGNFVASFNEQLTQLLGPNSWQVEFRNTSYANASPRILLRGQVLQIEFPDAFFAWMDEAAMFMHGDRPYRNALSICQARPKIDHSRLFHLLWGLWIAYHEISHFLCGHLAYLATREFVEFDALPNAGRSSDERRSRRAMEVDADILAAKFFFKHIARMSTKRYWDDLYAIEDVDVLLMQDLALIFLPLFMEMSHVESKDPQTSTHPAAMQRLVVFQTFGFSAYGREAGPESSKHLGAYLAGFRKAIELLIHIDNSMLHEPPESPDFEAYKKALLELRMQDRRIVRLDDDWLASDFAAA